MALNTKYKVSTEFVFVIRGERSSYRFDYNRKQRMDNNKETKRNLALNSIHAIAIDY